MNKNLKKVISSVAAISMVASSVAALAVDFPDVESTASYAQAVNELSSLNVISGYDDGTFGPDKLVTRAEITKMIVDALGEGSSAESAKGTSTKFADVSSDHWATGYIAQGVSDGFISGHSDTEFAPDSNVTFVQAQKMLVSAIGYDTYAQGAGGWPTGYKTQATSLNINKGVSGVSDSTELTRAQVAQMIDNAMGAPICIITEWKTEWNGAQTPVLDVKDGTGKEYQTLFTKYHDAYKVYGRVLETNKTNQSIDTDKVSFQVEKADNFDDEYIKNSDNYVIEDMYIGNSKADEALRTYAQALIQKNDDDEFTILSLSAAAANKSVTLAAEDFDDSKSDADKLYFYPAGTTRGSVKYELDTDKGVTVYINGVEQTVNYVDYIANHETASVTLQKETNPGTTSSSSKYNVIMISSYATAVVDEVIEKSNEISVNFKEYSAGIGTKMTVYKDDDSYSYNFVLDGASIEVTELEEDDVLNIAYNTENFKESNFYDVIVTREKIEDAKCTGINTANEEYTIGGTKYKVAEGMSISIETSSSYNLMLDHFGKIASAEESSVSKNYGILKNIYKKAAGDYMAQVITKEGTEEEYKVDDKNVDLYTTLLSTYNNQDKSADYSQTGKTKLDLYPQQVIEYSVSTSSNKITIKNDVDDNNKLVPVGGTSATDAEYKESSNRIGSVKLSDASIILDISEVNSKDEYRVVSALTDAQTYSAYGYDKSKSDSIYRFVLLTSGTSAFTSETQLAIFNGSELVDDGDDDRTAYNVIINGEESQVILDDDVEGADDFEEGDAIIFRTNSAGYVSEVLSVFTNVNALNGTSYDAFSESVRNGSKIIASDFSTELSDSNDDVEVIFGVAVNKVGNSITIGKVESDNKSVNYDNGTEISTSGAKIYTYDFAASSKNSRVLLDEGLMVTPDVKAAKTTASNGAEILDITHEDVAGDVVFAVARVIDDEAQEIYLIVNND